MDMTATTAPTTYAIRYVARGFTDDVTTCEHCGKQNLKGTVRMAAVDPDGGEDGDTYMGVTCAARMTGRKAAEIRTEANRADRARQQAIRDTHRAWSDAHTTWFCNTRDAALGTNVRYREISAWMDTDECKAAEAAWLAEHPEPPRPY